LKNYPSWKELVSLAALAIAAIIVHGYHPGVEDAEIYLPGILKALNPSLYPENQAFFSSHARMTLFPDLIAASVKLLHLPLAWTLLLWHWFSIFLLLLACWHLGRLCFSGSLARWGGISMLASLLTLPVAGTALYIMDEYLTTRSLSTPAVLFIVINAAERKFGRAILWAVLTAAIHPLMVVFGAAYATLLILVSSQRLSPVRQAEVMAAALFPFGLFPPVTREYWAALNSRPYFFLLRWRWYEWIGIFAPLILFWIFSAVAKKSYNRTLQRMCSASIIFGLLFFAVALVITVPVRLANLVELQPMRSLHLLYILLLVFAGGLLADFVLRRSVWRWAVFFLPLCGLMASVQRQTFPATNHLELPGVAPRNEWVRAFRWVQESTPTDAYFALHPDHMADVGEDQHGFRAIAERSRLADNVKDAGAVTMFPALAQTWQTQVAAQANWDRFDASDFRSLKKRFGVDWVVIRKPDISGLVCPYQSETLLVCKIE
jgi:hypothetical protein